MGIGDGLASLAAFEERINHLTDDRAGTDDRYLHYDVVKALRAKTRQAGHLRAALDLEHANGVRFLQGGVNQWIIGRQVREIDLLATVSADNFNRFFQNRHHAEAK